MPDNEIYKVSDGRPCPLGAIYYKDQNGVNFSIFSSEATRVQLLLFDNVTDLEPTQIIELDSEKNREFGFWHVFVEGLKPKKYYAYRIDGPNDISTNGNRFDFNKVLIDPYAKAICEDLWNREKATDNSDNILTSMRCSIIDVSDYDWENDQHPRHNMNETIIYEMHTRGFTQSDSSNVENKGTFSGIIEKIPYLKGLGVTAVELLPVMEFDGKSILHYGPNNEPLKNYWGYSTVNFFSPHSGYCTSPDESKQLDEFRDLVKELHKNNIEVILDVVFNHTDEGNENGPVFSFKGIDNSLYYYLAPNDKRYYMNYSGCGNTINCNHPIVQKLIIESLEYWVTEMHVDGFRFDEGSILSRGLDGLPMEYPPVLWGIELRESLDGAKLITEPWDSDQLYQMGHIHGYRWTQWNGKFRDDVRQFIKGDNGKIGAIAYRISGSNDLYQRTDHLPINGINFITAHDGFTLNDLVSYNYKHNYNNGENNNDGNNTNDSWNCGVEGSTDNADIESLRIRQIKNFAAILLLSRGVPMITSGDEVRRTQNGNNNSYCQDNELNWFDWTLADKNKEILEFFTFMIKFRKENHSLHSRNFYNGSVNERGLKDINWHGTMLNNIDWDNYFSHALSFTVAGFNGDSDIHVMMNMYWEPLSFEIPVIPQRQWYKVADTSENKVGNEILITGSNYTLNDRSIAIFISK
ncbi:MAG: glycogen debranching protein GlgX [bacterium]